MSKPRLFMLAAIAAVALPQSSPPVFFELLLPGDRAIPGGKNVVVDYPAHEITQMTIQVMGSADTSLTYGDLKVRINGKGAGNLFDSGSNARGKFKRMTPETLRMRHDQLFNPDENTVEIFGKDKRGREFYQNWVLRNGGSAANPYFTYVASMSPTDEAGIPPDLDITAPDKPILFSGDRASLTVHVKASASAGSGIASLTVNGKPAPAGPGTSATAEMDTAITRETKSIIVEAVDKKGNHKSLSVPVVHPAAAPPPRLAGQAWAVVIGVSRFGAKSGAPPSVPLAAMDAKQFAEALIANGFKESNIRLLTDEKATTEQIRTALGDFTNKAKPEDLLVLYWATQGLHDPASPDNVYLAGADAQLLSLSSTAIEMSELRLLLEPVRSRHTILFFDVEHPLGPEWAFPGVPMVNTHVLNLFDENLGRSVLVAGASAAPSPTASGRSIFSDAVIEGLGGKADVDKNRVVTAREICDYTIQRVREQSGGNQTPRAAVVQRDELPVLSVGR